MMNKLIWRILVCGIVTLSELAHADSLEPPKLQLVDRNNVNMAAGKLNIKQTDLNIGAGGLVLSHTIASYGNEFLGYTENFRGRVYLSQRKIFATNTYINIMRVVTGEETVDFDIATDGTYVGLKDQLSTLVRVGNSYIFTAVDGTEIKFICESSAANSDAVMVEKKFPNGFTVTINLKSNVAFSPILSVTTNNGLELKYLYVDVNDGNVNSLSWSRQYPKSISAVNNATEYCSSGAANCTFSNTWPTVTYDWPSGLPNSMRTSYQFGEKIFKVTDPIGGTTEYYQKGFDMNAGLGSNGPGPDFIPAITKIKNSKGTIEYDYKNYVANGQMKQAVVLYTALRNGASWSYSLLNQTTDMGGILITHTCSGFDCLSNVNTDVQYGALTNVMTDGQSIELDRSFANHFTKVTYGVGNYVTFGYDARGHINKRSEYPRPSSSLAPIVLEANYDVTCANPKTCNQPNWISDAKGQRTDYTYHAQSGQVATVTKPAPVTGGVRPQTRYTYVQKYAWYKASDGTYQKASSPIWLKATESFCRTSTATVSGCSVEGDEVVTTFDYGPDSGPNNLFLRGVAITVDGVTRRTCYSYDNLGNRIGETLPKAGLASCQ